MLNRGTVDAILVQWGDRLFYPANRISKPALPPRVPAGTAERADAIRGRIHTVTTGGAPQAIMKISGGGHGMRPIASHFRYITRGDALDMEDDRGIQRCGKPAVRDLLDQWRHSGSLIEQVSPRQEAFYFVCSAPEGSDPRQLLNATRGFAVTELKDHLYVMVLHVDRNNPHVHLTVRAESKLGQHLRDRTWIERERWRESYAEQLRGVGIEVDATRQSVRGEMRNHDAMWKLKAIARGDASRTPDTPPYGEQHLRSRAQSMEGWSHMLRALADSELPEDRQLAVRAGRFVESTPFFREVITPAARIAALALMRQPDPGHRPRIEITR